MAQEIPGRSQHKGTNEGLSITMAHLELAGIEISIKGDKTMKRPGFQKIVWKGQIALLLISGVISVSLKADSISGLFPAEKSCVAYRTIKGMFLVANVEVVGKNCSITSKLQAGQRISVDIPIANFDSESSARDEHVFEILQGDSHPRLQFISEPLGGGLEGVKDGDTVSGVLTIGGKPKPASWTIQVRANDGQRVFSGVLSTTYTAYGIEPPKAGPGGLIADTPDKLELIFQIRESDIQR